MKVPVGPSTWAMLIAALGAAVAFVTEWSQSGSAPVWLAGIATGLTAVLGILRSWQANTQTAYTPTDAAVLESYDPYDPRNAGTQ
jgi:hypothetical protein